MDVTDRAWRERGGGKAGGSVPACGASGTEGRNGSAIQLFGGWHWHAEAQVLGWLEADLDTRVQPELDVLGSEAGIAPGFQEPPGQVLGRAHPLGDGLT